MLGFIHFLCAVLVLPFLTKARHLQQSLHPRHSPVVNASHTRTANPNGCTMAEPYANDTRMCVPYYNHTDGVCKSTIPHGSLIFSSGPHDQRAKEDELMTITFHASRDDRFFQKFFLDKSSEIMGSLCFQMIRDIYCHHYFPRCDNTTRVVQRRLICRTTCEALNRRCRATWTYWMKTLKGVTWKAQSVIGSSINNTVLMDCTTLPNMSHPNIPDCLDSKLISASTAQLARNFQDASCYYEDDRGNSYRGDVNRTRSGFACQAWSHQCPHRHSRTPEEYRELFGAGNACRNPGSVASSGPWCYTADRRVRWEYCDVPKCLQETNKRMHVKRDQKSQHKFSPKPV